MTKIIKSLLFFALIAFTMVACREDIELPASGAPGNPEKEIAGTYTGNMTRTNVGTGAVEDLTTSLIIEASDQPYIATITVRSDDGTVERSAQANVIKQSGAYRFFNEVTSNPLGSAFTGQVTFDGIASITFVVEERSGKRVVKNQYDFSGSK